MPLPNLRDRSLVNTTTQHASQSSSDNFESGGASYRELIKEKILNTPRQQNAGEHTRRSIDLSINRENNYRSSSRLSYTYRNKGDENRMENAIEWATKNNGSVSSRRRQVVFYNKTYVPSDEDGIQSTSTNENDTTIQDDEYEDDDDDNVITNNANNGRQSSRRKNGLNTSLPTNSGLRDRHAKQKEMESVANQRGDIENRKRFENSRPNSIETNYNNEENSDDDTHESSMSNNVSQKTNSSYLSRRSGGGAGAGGEGITPREHQRNPFPDLNSSSSIDFNNNNSGVANRAG